MSIIVGTRPCITVECDNCQEPLGYGDYDHTHYEDERSARDGAKDADWYVDAGVLICIGCCDDAPLYEVACPSCGAQIEESCQNGGRPVFCEERVAAFAAKVAEKATALTKERS